MDKERRASLATVATIATGIIALAALGGLWVTQGQLSAKGRPFASALAAQAEGVEKARLQAPSKTQTSPGSEKGTTAAQGTAGKPQGDGAEAGEKTAADGSSEDTATGSTSEAAAVGGASGGVARGGAGTSGNAGGSGSATGQTGGGGSTVARPQAVWHEPWDEWVASGYYENKYVEHPEVWGTRRIYGTRCNDCGFTTTGSIYPHKEETGHHGYSTGVEIGTEAFLAAEAWTETVQTWVDSSHMVHHDGYWN